MTSGEQPTIIFLNGPSSSGKSSLAKLLQEKLEEPYLYIGIDKLIDLMPEKLNDWRGGIVDQGFWWKKSIDSHGHEIAEIQLGPYARKVRNMLPDIAFVIASNGHNVIIDEVCISPGNFELWQKKLEKFSVLYVGIKSPTHVLEEREQKRNDRMLGSARAQNAIVHENKSYDLEFDTSVLSLDKCVDEIVTRIESWKS